MATARAILETKTGTTEYQAFEHRIELPLRYSYALALYALGRVVSQGTSLIPSEAVLHTVRTPLGSMIAELESLREQRTNEFRPTKHAIRSAKFYLYEVYAKMFDRFPKPFFVLDGEGGIIIKWVGYNGRTVRLNCLADSTDPDYIYFENGEYDIEDNITPDRLKARLEWLTGHEREPAR